MMIMFPLTFLSNAFVPVEHPARLARGVRQGQPGHPRRHRGPRPDQRRPGHRPGRLGAARLRGRRGDLRPALGAVLQPQDVAAAGRGEAATRSGDSRDIDRVPTRGMDAVGPRGLEEDLTRPGGPPPSCAHLVRIRLARAAVGPRRSRIARSCTHRQAPRRDARSRASSSSVEVSRTASVQSVAGDFSRAPMKYWNVVGREVDRRRRPGAAVLERRCRRASVRQPTRSSSAEQRVVA